MTLDGRQLGASAKSAILWSGGFTLLRDVLQFLAMLVLVRLLSPEDYGSAALAQSIIGFIAVFSFGTFILHALQVRDPAEVDWQAHFTAAVFINLMLFVLTLLIAWGLSFSATYHSAALPLAVLATLLIVEIPGTLRHRMLETRHDWKRFRILVGIGTALALFVGVAIALMGGGVWALVVQPPLFGLPAAIDLFLNEKWRPNWSWSWARYREAAGFGLNRMGSTAVIRARQAVEQGYLTSTYDFATLGVFTRAQGLATLIAGRIGSVATTTLYPILTRAEEQSDQFQHMAGMVLRGVSWTTMPAAVFLALAADDLVSLLYGPKWESVASLLPYGTAVLALGGITATLTNLLLANKQSNTSLAIDLISAAVAVGVAVVFIPFGLEIYLMALAVQSLLVLFIAIFYLHRTHGVTRISLNWAFIPPVISCMIATLAMQQLTMRGAVLHYLSLNLLLNAIVFSFFYLITLRIAFPIRMKELLQVVPGGSLMQAWLFIY